MKFLVFPGTVRDSTPPRPARLGVRVSKACLDCLSTEFPEHEVDAHKMTIDFKKNPSERNAS